MTSLFFLEATRSTPLVRFDAENATLHITGESYPENSFHFYAPVLSWLEAALAEHDRFTLSLAITYMNSSSVKCMLDVMDMLQAGCDRGVQVAVTWFYDPDNPRALDLAEEFQEELTLPFSIIPVIGEV